MAKLKCSRILSCLMAAALMLSVFSGLALAADSDNGFTFSDSGIAVSGSGTGYEIDGTDLKITEAGTYTVSGSCADGSITVKKAVTGVTLILSSLTLKCSYSAPISINKTASASITLSGSSSLTDSENPADEDSTDTDIADAFEGACIKVKAGGSLTISGSGSLTLDGSACKNGIKGGATAAITIAGGTIGITAANNALASDGSLSITGGTLNINATGDGIKSSPEDDDTESAGTIDISGGSITVVSGEDAIQADGNLTITGGTFNIKAGDDAIHSEYLLTIGTKGSSTGPSITVSSCVEGFEGAAVILNSGSGTVKSSDDGVNAANGDLTGYSYDITINGGDWYINADGDGLDSNGTVTIAGGTTEVYGAANSGNAALDFDSSCTYTGGTLLSVGMSGMAQAPTSGVSVSFGVNGMGGTGGQLPGGTTPGGQTRPTRPGSSIFSSGLTTTAASTISISSGSSIAIKDSSGTTLYTATGVKSANSVVFADDSLVSGSTYSLYVNGSSVATATAATGSGGQQPGGTLPDGTTPPEGTENPTQPGTGFTDVAAGDWFFDSVDYVRKNNLMTGTSDTTFEPNSGLNRAMLVTILYRLEGSPAASGSAFSDVASGSWYADAVGWASANGIVEGYSNGCFGPTDSITREQMATILFRYAKYKGYDVTATASSLSYTDSDQISSYAGEAMQWAVAKSLITGDGTSLTPTAGATRAQTATIIMRFIENIAK